ncbi:unnamed protein product [Adineta ricciae]|uniref:Uncharacterized protein n=1 Tax=Adineta ricciae TaxID=249248 RepID=A0A814N9B9_ADIRI|nr:unnamed protein product [Adineta ricciae]
MGNSRSNYERHEDDEQQQRMVIGKEFRLLLGQLRLSSDLIKRHRILFRNKQQYHREPSSSSSNSTIASSASFDQPNSAVSFIQLDIPTSPIDAKEFDTHAFMQYLLQQESYGKELSHVFRIPMNITKTHKIRTKTLPTMKIAAVYYEQPCSTHDLNIETFSLDYEAELERKIEQFNDKNILSIYISKSSAYVIYTKSSSLHSKYKLIRSTTMSKTALDNFEWLHPFIDYSNLGCRLCGIIPFANCPMENSLTIYWVFEQVDTNETIQYDYSLIECQLKVSSAPNWCSLLNLMVKQEWKLVATLDYNQKKKTNEQTYFLLFFQRLKHLRD